MPEQALRGIPLGLGLVIEVLNLLNFHVCVYTGLKPPPPYTAPTSGLSLNPTLTATTTVSGLTGLTSKLTTTTTAAPGVGLGLGLPKPTAASTIKPGLTGLTTAATTASTGLTSSAAGGAAGGYGKKYTYKELENLVNKVRGCGYGCGQEHMELTQDFCFSPPQNMNIFTACSESDSDTQSFHSSDTHAHTHTHTHTHIYLHDCTYTCAVES